MDWQTTSVILGVLGTIAVAIIRLAPERKQTVGKMEQEAQQDLEQSTTEKLDRIQSDVNDLEVDVGKLQTQQSNTAQEITGIRSQLNDLRNDVVSLRQWLMERRT